MSENITSQSCENLQTSVSPGGAVSVTQTSAISSLVVNKSLSKLEILRMILGRSFQWCQRIFPNLFMSKVEKKRRKLRCIQDHTDRKLTLYHHNPTENDGKKKKLRYSVLFRKLYVPLENFKFKNP